MAEYNQDFRRFSQKNDIFNRIHWDNSVSTSRARAWFRSMLLAHRTSTTPGYTQRDYALRNGGWTLANRTFLDGEERREGFLDLLTPTGAQHPHAYQASAEELTSMLRRACRAYGIDQMGITATDLKYHYSHRYNYDTGGERPAESVEGLDNCVVIAMDMPYDVVSTYPSATAGAGPGYGYSRNILALQTVAGYIRHLGYRAVASLNDTAQGIPYALAAGLGEYGRNGLLINPRYGPRFRIGKIFTDMPLTHNSPIDFGVKQLCATCRKCVNACPPRAIPSGRPSFKIHNISNQLGVKKWSVDAERCMSFWAQQGTECGICVRVCPFNKDLSRWSHRLYNRFVFKPLLTLGWHKILLGFETLLGFGRRTHPDIWWKS